MKNSILLLLASAFLLIGNSNCSPKVYTNVADTLDLNNEYRTVTRDIAKVTSQIEDLRSKIPVYEARAQKESAQSKEALDESSEQSSKATSGKMKEIRKAEKKADKAENEAIDARDAAEKAKETKEKLNSLTIALAKKEARLKELDTQRANIGKSTGQTL